MQRTIRAFIILSIAILLLVCDQTGAVPVENSLLPQLKIKYDDLKNEQNINFDIAAEVLLSILVKEGIVYTNEEN